MGGTKKRQQYEHIPRAKGATPQTAKDVGYSKKAFDVLQKSDKVLNRARKTRDRVNKALKAQPNDGYASQHMRGRGK